MADYKDKTRTGVTRASFSLAVSPGRVATVLSVTPDFNWYSGRTIIASYTQPPAAPLVRWFSFRGVAASYATPPTPVKSAVMKGRVAIVTSEPPNLYAYSERWTVSSYTRVPNETWVLWFSYRTTVTSYTVAPTTVTTAIVKGRIATVLSEPPDVLLYSMRRVIGTHGLPPQKLGRIIQKGRIAAVVRMPPVAARVYRATLLIQQSDNTTPARVGSVYSELSVKADYLSTDATISPQNVVQATESVAVRGDDLDHPISLEDVPQSFASCALANDAVMPWSNMDTPQAYTVYAANGGYMLPEFVYSPEDVRAVGQLVAMSSIFEYKPISGLTVPQVNYTLASSAEYPWPETLTFPGDVGQLGLSWAQRVNMGRMPRSITRVPFVGSLYSAQAPAAGIPWSLTTAVTVGNIIAAASTPPPPEDYRSITDAVSVGNLVSMSSPAIEPTGPIANKSLGLFVAVAADYDEIGPSPSHLAEGANVMFASKTRGVVMPKGAAQLGQLSIDWSKRATYPSPEEMYERNAVGQYGQLIGQQSTPWTTISQESVRQLSQAIATHSPTVPPDEVYGSGVFIGQLGQSVMTEAKYPDVRIPFSTIDVDTVGQQLARAADYPDKATPQSSVTVSQSVLQVLRSVTYPDLNAPVSFAAADILGQQVATPTGYPDKDTILSLAVVDATGQQLARTREYLDKDLVQSKAIIQQLGEQTATVAAYPNKDMPLSQAQVTLIRQQVLQRNEALSSMPVKLPKHRAQITITFL